MCVCCVAQVKFVHLSVTTSIIQNRTRKTMKGRNAVVHTTRNGGPITVASYHADGRRSLSIKSQ